ncbi:hypothetical protein HH212_00810 [Massilia forsythiae]|uniref:Pilus assembly protein PilO n=1 Tax=Massilia forsythiae TaxID=2728020 RepID=A0A7Z2VTK2_9BURK|nr:hypothetical protein [Massilia forsythiae]QJD98761.1 hypothetical protein HH212_00810 [Massilia forsythiae]
MTQSTLAALPLRLRLWLARMAPLSLAALLAIVPCAAALAWVTLAQLGLERDLEQARARVAARRAQAEAPARPAAVAASAATAPVAAAPADNLDLFYGTLGQRRHAEQQVKTLFALAAKNGLVLSQGEYKSAWDKNARVHTYQVNLPVKGSYAAIWEFALASLRAIPFAALDDISFKRDSIADAAVEARLRLTLYLGESDAVAREGAP